MKKRPNSGEPSPDKHKLRKALPEDDIFRILAEDQEIRKLLMHTKEGIQRTKQEIKEAIENGETQINRVKQQLLEQQKEFSKVINEQKKQWHLIDEVTEQKETLNKDLNEEEEHVKRNNRYRKEQV